MRSPNALTSALEPRCCASLPSSTSAMPPLAAFTKNAFASVTPVACSVPTAMLVLASTMSVPPRTNRKTLVIACPPLDTRVVQSTCPHAITVGARVELRQTRSNGERGQEQAPSLTRALATRESHQRSRGPGALYLLLLRGD